MPNEKVEKIKPFFVDERGAITNILSQDLKHVSIITSKKGAVRGNHYHAHHVQYVYLISGKFESITKDLKNPNAKEEKIIVEAGDLVTTPANIAHAMKFLEDSVFLALLTDHRGFEEEDTHKHVLVK